MLSDELAGGDCLEIVVGVYRQADDVGILHMVDDVVVQIPGHVHVLRYGTKSEDQLHIMTGTLSLGRENAQTIVVQVVTGIEKDDLHGLSPKDSFCRGAFPRQGRIF